MVSFRSDVALCFRGNVCGPVQYRALFCASANIGKYGSHAVCCVVHANGEIVKACVEGAFGCLCLGCIESGGWGGLVIIPLV